MAEEITAPQSTSYTGLTDSEARKRLRQYGPNVLPSGNKLTLFSIVLGTLKEPMIILLLSTGLVYLLVGDLREAIAILASIFIVIGISTTQKHRTERTLEALRDLTSPRALVMRSEAMRRIPAREVVPGDIVILNEGDRVPADGRVLESVLLALDESLLTGESIPVDKGPAIAAGSGKASESAMVYSATLVVRGHGIVVVSATGAESEIGKIGTQLGQVRPESTKLEKETAKLVRTFGILGLLVCGFVAGMYGLLRGDWAKGVISALALAISLVPEEFPLVLAIFMAIGAWRISQKKVLTRQFPAIEMLGAATVICVDKTGTLTENRMAVQEVFVSPQENGMATTDEVLQIAALASEENTADPVDKAVVAARPAHTSPGRLIREYPLSSDCMLVAKAYAGSPIFLAAKGAPEQIFGLSPMPGHLRDALESALERMTGGGMRVIAVARGATLGGELPDDKRRLRLEVLGLIGLADPIRSTVPGAVVELAKAGIRVVMITGDYPGTATAIATQAGLLDPAHVVTGDSLARMDAPELQAMVRDCNVFARVRPEQKLRLVEALKANREVVAMTGDGVNDAPALKAAHIGIAMGARGSDVAREAAALVLADDDFPAIVDAVRLGRRIYDNLTNAVRYVFAVHVPIAGLAVLPVIFNWPILLMPLHIVFFELIVDPACSIAFEAEAEEPGIMGRKPRPEQARLFSRSTVTLGLLQGLGVLVAVLIAFIFAMRWGHAPEHARAIAFTALVAGNLTLIWANRSALRIAFEEGRVRNTALWLVSLWTIATLLAVLYVPGIRMVFQFSVLPAKDLVISFALGSVSITWFEMMKLVRRRRAKPSTDP
ncbi:MAG TPA: cation-translocating P-type ATPase [Terriglobales bacterium]|nr:cation-translocating P-type ATPase [Terriglobales bacterium]